MPDQNTIDRIRLQQIIEANKDRPFVDRIVNRSQYPVMENEDGSVSTHRMAWAGGDDGHYVYPTVQHKGGKLFIPEDPYRYARENNDFIKFDTPEDADWFSKKYKLLWDDQVD